MPTPPPPATSWCLHASKAYPHSMSQSLTDSKQGNAPFVHPPFSRTSPPPPPPSLEKIRAKSSAPVMNPAFKALVERTCQRALEGSSLPVIDRNWSFGAPRYHPGAIKIARRNLEERQRAESQDASSRTLSFAGSQYSEDKDAAYARELDPKNLFAEALIPKGSQRGLTFIESYRPRRERKRRAHRKPPSLALRPAPSGVRKLT